MDKLLLTAGHSYEVSITPTVVNTDDDVAAIEAAKGRCQPADSKTLEFYQNYSQPACLFECRLRKARNACGCTPWEYPQPGPPWSICPQVGEVCFMDHMKMPVAAKKCGCLPDCSTLRYDYKVAM